MIKLDYTFSREYVFLGTTADRARVLISGRLCRQAASRDVETVNHETVNKPESLSVNVIAFTGRKNIKRNIADGLHSIEYFGPRIITPAPGYTIGEVHELVALGQRWRNNNIRAACAHMAEPEGDTVSTKLGAGVTCPVTGRKWGSRWYTDPLPDDVRARFIELMEKGRTEECDY